MRICPFYDCRNRIPNRHFACKRHFQMLTDEELEQATGFVVSFYANEITYATMRKLVKAWAKAAMARNDAAIKANDKAWEETEPYWEH